MTKVELQYKYQGIINPRDNEVGILFNDGTVLACSDGMFDIYHAKETNKPGVLLVDLDSNSYDLGLNDNPRLLIDKLLAL
ncbi:hypothetical protein ABER68_04230 [Paenibacillus alvei]